MNLLIKGAKVLSLKDKGSVLEKDIAVSFGRIKYLGKIPKSFKPQKTIQAKDKIAMPGLINSHVHVPMTLFRNLADDLPLNIWLQKKIWPLEQKLNKEDIYWGALLGLAEMIKGGITSFCDMYLKTEIIAKALEESKMRGILSEVVFGGVKDNQENIKYIKKTIHKWQKNPKIRFSLAPHSAYACQEDLIKTFIDLSQELKVPIHIHLSESEKEVKDSLRAHQKSPVEYLESLGVFERPTKACHCVHLTDHDIEILKNYKVNVLYCPTSNLKLANGFAPVNKLQEKGVNVALGTDGPASNNNLNMFEEIHLAAIINKGISGDATAVPAIEALKMATINGARALGLEDEVGSIEVDKKADLILVDTGAPHFEPKSNLISSLVYSTQAFDVETVIVDGEILMEERVLKTIDIEKVIFEIQKRIKGLIKD